ncbi:MAG: hypothetical protein HC783_08280, partial [Rhodobacteraceae bacterium]|nr:hypothetical protein [Paracoccaceae bacterium]
AGARGTEKGTRSCRCVTRFTCSTSRAAATVSGRGWPRFRGSGDYLCAQVFVLVMIIAAAFAAIEGQLRWARRASATIDEQTFWNGHANAVILGPGGLEARDDLWVGVTVMAPGVDYVDHHHAPEEVYLALSPGEWWNSDMDWTDPGPTGAIYNPPGITHAMRSGTGPFLALWYLPL